MNREEINERFNKKLTLNNAILQLILEQMDLYYKGGEENLGNIITNIVRLMDLDVSEYTEALNQLENENE